MSNPTPMRRRGHHRARYYVVCFAVVCLSAAAFSLAALDSTCLPVPAGQTLLARAVLNDVGVPPGLVVIKASSAPRLIPLAPPRAKSKRFSPQVTLCRFVS